MSRRTYNGPTFTVRTLRTEVLEVRSTTLHDLTDPDERSQLQHALEPEHDLENPTIETVKAVAEIYKRRMARRIELEFKTSMITTYDWQVTTAEYPKDQYSKFMMQITATIIIHQSGSHEFTHRTPESWDIK